MKAGNSKRAMAAELGIGKSSLYYQLKQPKKDWATKVLIEKALHDNPSYGHKRLASHLKINKKRVRRVMKMFGIKPYRRRGKKWRHRKAGTGIACANLLLNTMPLYPNHLWASDFTYLWFENAWLYVATIIDLYTRRIVGLAISRSHDRCLVQTALLDALTHYPRPLIAHSDQGSEYKSKDYQTALKEFSITPSMSAKGCPWENGYQESFYSQFKIDLGEVNRFTTLGELTAELYRQIYYYNNQRIHTAIKMAPVALARRYDMLNLLVH